MYLELKTGHQRERALFAKVLIWGRKISYMLLRAVFKRTLWCRSRAVYSIRYLTRWPRHRQAVMGMPMMVHIVSTAQSNRSHRSGKNCGQARAFLASSPVSDILRSY